MCGITGAISFTTKGRFYLKFVEQANKTLSKRGPDAGNVLVKEDMAFGHRRLSIIDLSEDANQPMFDSSGRYIIVYNGEIFNYKTLRDDLKKQGVSFKTSSDTEVILELYKKYKHDFLNKLNGFFAFAIYDLQTHEAF